MESGLLPGGPAAGREPRAPGELVKPRTAGLVNYALILLSRRWMVGISIAAGGALGLAITLLSAPVYQAQVVVLPEATSSATGMLTTTSDIPFLPTSGAAPFTDFHRQILESQALAERVARRLELPGRVVLSGKRRTWDELLLRQAQWLSARVRVVENGDRFAFGTRPALTLYARSRDPVLAADIASTYVLELDDYIRETTISSASRLRRFVERRLEETNRELEASQRALQAFQEKEGTVSVEEQAKATIQLLSQLEAQRVSAQVELEAESEIHSPEHSRVRSLQAQVDALTEKIHDLTYSKEDRVGVEQEGKIDFYVPVTRIPSLSFEASRLLLATTTQTEVVGLLRRQLEQAKIEEEKNLPLVTVLGPAAAPDDPVSPKPLLNLATGLTGGLFVGILLAFAHYFVMGPGRAGDVQSLREAMAHSWMEDRRRALHGLRAGPPWLGRLLRRRPGGRGRETDPGSRTGRDGNA